jgi:hypothetical protein
MNGFSFIGIEPDFEAPATFKYGCCGAPGVNDIPTQSCDGETYQQKKYGNRFYHC